MPRVAKKRDRLFSYGAAPPPNPPPLTTWWGIGSVSFGALGAGFLPAAIVGGGDWASMIYSIFPLWAICCLIGVATGIRGMMGRRLTRTQRLTAAVGMALSMLSFIVLTLIALMGGS